MRIFYTLLVASLLFFSAGCSTLKDAWTEHRDDVVAKLVEQLKSEDLDDAAIDAIVEAIDSSVAEVDSETTVE